MRVAQQIGWSQESKLIYNILKQLDRLEVVWDGCCAPITTTSTTTSGPCPTFYTLIPITPLTPFDIPATDPFSTQGDYTIEWFMNMTDDNNFPRIFSIGAYPSAQHAVSIEGDTLYYWVNGSIQNTASLTSYLGQWVWVVISRTVYTLDIYINGISVAAGLSTLAIPANGNDLIIGCEKVSQVDPPVNGTNYNGLLSNFRWTLGSVYGGGGDISGYFPTAPLTLLPETVVLVFQGNSLIEQIIPLYQDGTEFGFNYSGPCFTYSTDNPFEGYEGSLTFRS
jgi:hypothetical protein